MEYDWKIPIETNSESYAIHGNKKYFFNAGEKSIYRSFFEILTENEKKSKLGFCFCKFLILKNATKLVHCNLKYLVVM